MTSPEQTAAAWDGSTTPDVFVARQPIMTSDSEVVGYELLYRSTVDPDLVTRNPRAATGQVLAAALFSTGLERLVGTSRAWINFPREWLIEGVIGVLPAERVVLEILESVEVDDDLVETCRALKDQGFTLALDRYRPSDPRYPLLPLVDYAKVNIGDVEQDQWRALVHLFGANQTLPVASRVEDWFDLERSIDAGFGLYQGYYLMRPHIVTGKEVPVLDSTRLLALQVAANEHSSLEDVEGVVAHDAGLAFRLLRYLNAAAFGFRDPVGNVHDAVVRLGERGARTWLLLATIHALGKDRPLELISVSAIRARMCERLALVGGQERRSEDAFMAGLFRNIDAITGMHMSDVLEAVSLPNDVAAALSGQPAGVIGDILELAVAYEGGAWDTVGATAEALGLDQKQVAEEYVGSIDWAREALSI